MSCTCCPGKPTNTKPLSFMHACARTSTPIYTSAATTVIVLSLGIRNTGLPLHMKHHQYTQYLLVQVHLDRTEHSLKLCAKAIQLSGCGAEHDND